MKIFELFRTEPLSHGRIRKLYKNAGSSLACCKAIMQLLDFKKQKIRVTIHGEEMQPDRRVNAKSFAEIAEYSETSDISSCFFSGIFKGKEMNIVVDFSLKKLCVISDDETIVVEIEKQMEG